jgi:hypothetical protein
MIINRAIYEQEAPPSMGPEGGFFGAGFDAPLEEFQESQLFIRGMLSK